MKTSILFISILFPISAFAQSNLDFQDTRRRNESFSKVREPEIRSDLTGFTLSGIPESVGKEEFTKIPITSFSADSMVFEGNGIKALLKTTPFDKSQHKLTYDEKYLVRIDKKTYYGGYGRVPFKVVSQVLLLVDGDTVAIPAVAFADLYNMNFTYNDKGVQRSRNGVYRSKDGHRIYIYALSRDNTGSYEVTWVIQNKNYFRRVLDYDFM
jgi:hypothetical protein